MPKHSTELIYLLAFGALSNEYSPFSGWQVFFFRCLFSFHVYLSMQFHKRQYNSFIIHSTRCDSRLRIFFSYSISKWIFATERSTSHFQFRNCYCDLNVVFFSRALSISSFLLLRKRILCVTNIVEYWNEWIWREKPPLIHRQLFKCNSFYFACWIMFLI